MAKNVPVYELEVSKMQKNRLENAPESQDVPYSTLLSAQGRLGGIQGMSAERYDWQDEGDNG